MITPAEASVLETLIHGQWLTPTEISRIPPAADLHVQVIRSALKNLAGKRLVERGGWGDSTRWGDWRITNAGRARINEARQLRILATPIGVRQVP